MKSPMLSLGFAVSLALSANTMADERNDSSFKFKALQESANADLWNPAAPWKLPKGYTQEVISDETTLNVYAGGQTDWPDMNTVNETGKMAGRFLYRTHELRSAAGAVSVVDLETGEAKILVQDESYTALDGIRWTPWGSILFAEETAGGRLMEIKLNDDMMSAESVMDRPAVGRLAHEGIEVDADGNVYVVDEWRGRTVGCDGMVPCGGGVYKFVPDSYGDLSRGSLYALKINGRDGVGQGEWVGPIDAANARMSGSMMGAQSYQRPEDLEIIGDTLYVAVTEGPRDSDSKDGALKFNSELYEGRVISINLETLKVSNFIKPGVNVPVEIGKPGDANHQSGWDSVDNLAEAPDGSLVIIEDNKPSDIWFASTKTNKYGASRKVELFGSLSDPGAEGTGIYFSPLDPDTLYVNIQHSAAPDGDGTWAIRKVHGE